MLASVVMTYRDENGALQSLNIDIDKVDAIAWTDEAVELRGANPEHHGVHIPERNAKDTTDRATGGVCYYRDGKWYC
jgi:hypothetical protein